jgi:hypothetical protein
VRTAARANPEVEGARRPTTGAQPRIAAHRVYGGSRCPPSWSPVLLGFIAAFPLQALGGDALTVLVAVLAAAMTILTFLVLALSAASRRVGRVTEATRRNGKKARDRG